jgi:hypothetical protein
MKKLLVMLACSAASSAQATNLSATLSSGMNELLTTVAAEIDIGGPNDVSVGVGLGAKTMEGKIGLVTTLDIAKNLYAKARLNVGGGRYNPKDDSDFNYGLADVALGMKIKLYDRLYMEAGAMQRAVFDKNFDRTPGAYISASVAF